MRAHELLQCCAKTWKVNVHAAVHVTIAQLQLSTPVEPDRTVELVSTQSDSGHRTYHTSLEAVSGAGCTQLRK